MWIRIGITRKLWLVCNKATPHYGAKTLKENGLNLEWMDETLARPFVDTVMTSEGFLYSHRFTLNKPLFKCGLFFENPL